LLVCVAAAVQSERNNIKILSSTTNGPLSAMLVFQTKSSGKTSALQR